MVRTGIPTYIPSHATGISFPLFFGLRDPTEVANFQCAGGCHRANCGFCRPSAVEFPHLDSPVAVVAVRCNHALAPTNFVNRHITFLYVLIVTFLGKPSRSKLFLLYCGPVTCCRRNIFRWYMNAFHIFYIDSVSYYFFSYICCIKLTRKAPNQEFVLGREVPSRASFLLNFNSFHFLRTAP